MVILSLFCGLCTGNLDAVASAALNGAQSAVELSFSMAGILCLWSGVMEILNACGISQKIAALFRPLLRRLLPQASRDAETLAAVSANVSANLLGLGNAATPLGIQAACRMARGCGMGKRVNVYAALTRGAEDGLTVLLHIIPALVGLLTAVNMFRASGAMDLLTALCAPVLERLGIPPETVPLMLIRPVSGSGALAVASDLMTTHGPDSYIGRVAAVMMGSTETTFYTIAVYFGSAGIVRTRHTVPAALAADFTGFLAAALTVRLFFGT